MIYQTLAPLKRSELGLRWHRCAIAAESPESKAPGIRECVICPCFRLPLLAHNSCRQNLRDPIIMPKREERKNCPALQRLISRREDLGGELLVRESLRLDRTP